MGPVEPQVFKRRLLTLHKWSHSKMDTQVFPLWLSKSRTRHSISQDVDSIPGLAQVGDPVLPWAEA